jgi:hypothetical protein
MKMLFAFVVAALGLKGSKLLIKSTLINDIF